MQDVSTGLAIIAGLNVALLLLAYVQARRDILQRERQRRSLVEQRRLLEEQVQERTAQLSELSSNLQNVQEAEKAKLARDIHDELGSILVSARMDVSWARRRVEPLDPAAAQKLARASSTLDEGVQIKRRIIEDLRPTLLDNLGLSAALSWHISEACERGGLRAHLTLPEEDLEVPSPLSIALFRVVQEALTNVLRYAKARNVWVSLEHTGSGLALVLRDDGVGIAPQALAHRLSHGIVGMRQRIASLGGNFRIGRVAGGGTAIEVFVPLGGRDAPAASPEPAAPAAAAQRGGSVLARRRCRHPSGSPAPLRGTGFTPELQVLHPVFGGSTARNFAAGGAVRPIRQPVGRGVTLRIGRCGCPQ